MSAELLVTARTAAARPLWLLNEAALAPWLAQQPAAVVNWVRTHNFQGRTPAAAGAAGRGGGRWAVRYWASAPCASPTT